MKAKKTKPKTSSAAVSPTKQATPPTSPKAPSPKPRGQPRTEPAKAKPAATKPVTAKQPTKPAKTASPRKPAARKKTAPAVLLEGDVPASPPAHGPGQRYALGPSAPPSHAPAVEPGELPEAYGTKQIFLTARDPHWLYASWDLTGEQQRHYNRLSADGHLVVRVYLNTIAGKPHSEVHVHPESRNWFVHVGKGGARYLGQLGYFGSRGKWATIAESKPTLTPPETLSEDTSVRFAALPPEVPFDQLLDAVKGAAREHLPLAEAIRQMAGEKSAPARSEPAWMQLVGAPEPAQWTPAQERALEQIVSLDSIRRIWVGSLEITELIRRQLARDRLPAEAGRALPAGVPALAPGALGSISSPFGIPPAKGEKGFWFNVNAELVIYGATEKDAQVSIGGRPIKLRTDGTFSYRFALPDGDYSLPVTAQAADQSEARSAELTFNRRTKYRGDVGRHPQDPTLAAPLPENIP